MGKLAKVAFGLFLVVYFLYLVAAYAPAQLVAGALVNNVPNLKLGGISGTVWRGRAAAASLNIAGKEFDLGALRWKVNVPALLSANLCSDVETALFNGKACRSISGKNKLEQFFLDEFAVSTLNDFLPVQLGGSSSLTVKKLVVDDQGMVDELDAHLTWMRARGDGGAGWYPLGSYAAELSENGRGGIKAQVSDVGGEFEVALEGEVGVRELPRARGTVKPRPEAPQILVDSLMLVGEQLEDGSFRLSWPIGS